MAVRAEADVSHLVAQRHQVVAGFAPLGVVVLTEGERRTLVPHRDQQVRLVVPPLTQHAEQLRRQAPAHRQVRGGVAVGVDVQDELDKRALPVVQLRGIGVGHAILPS